MAWLAGARSSQTPLPLDLTAADEALLQIEEAQQRR
jgi:hypothetical protein